MAAQNFSFAPKFFRAKFCILDENFSTKIRQFSGSQKIRKRRQLLSWHPCHDATANYTASKTAHGSSHCQSNKQRVVAVSPWRVDSGTRLWPVSRWVRDAWRGMHDARLSSTDWHWILSSARLADDRCSPTSGGAECSQKLASEDLVCSLATHRRTLS